MNNIEEKISELQDYDKNKYLPQIFDLSKEEDRQSVNSLLENKEIIKVIDYLSEQKGELKLVKNPKLLYSKNEEEKTKNEEGVWVYYPWHLALVHCLDKENYNKLRLSRNRDLITEDEQKSFRELKIGFAGLNVGNPIAMCVAIEGGSLEMMKLADNDTLDFTNLNRFRATVCDQGMNKAVLTARQIYEVNPFVRTEVLPNGITEKGIDDFLVKPRVDILVEEMDNLPLKIKIREKARDYGIPVVMITGNGAGVIVDIERYDKEKNKPILNGFLKSDIIDKVKEGPKTLDEKVALAADFMGREFLSDRLNQSFDLIGRQLSGIPQISEASFLRGAVVCYILRNLFSDNIQSGRYSFQLSEIFKK